MTSLPSTGGPKLSVIMPSLDSEEFIGRAIESVLRQTEPDLELVIQDGGSVDRTADVVRSLDDPRVIFVSEPDRGQSDALNRALRRARGAWILWLNSDDELAPGAASRLLSCAGGHDFVYGDFGMMDADSRVVKRYETPEFSFRRIRRRGAYIFSGAAMVRRDVFDRVGGFDAELSYCMDYEFFCRAAKDVKPTYCPGITAYLRDHGATKSRRQPWGFWVEQAKVARRYGLPWNEVVQNQIKCAIFTFGNPIRRSRTWRRIRPKKRL